MQSFEFSSYFAVTFSHVQTGKRKGKYNIACIFVSSLDGSLFSHLNMNLVFFFFIQFIAVTVTVVMIRGIVELTFTDSLLCDKH